MLMRRGWSRVRGTPPGVQTWENAPYDAEVVPADANVGGDAQLKHAKEQIALAGQYPGRARGFPSAEIINIRHPSRS
jgi:hypothetical protein